MPLKTCILFQWFNVSRRSSAQHLSVQQFSNNWGIWLQLLRMVQIPPLRMVSRWDSYQLHAGFFSLHNYFGGEITPGKHTPLIDFQPLKKGLPMEISIGPRPMKISGSGKGAMEDEGCKWYQAKKISKTKKRHMVDGSEIPGVPVEKYISKKYSK